MAVRVWKLLRDDTGGIRWDGLALVCGWLGVTDMEALMPRLELLKTHRRATEET